MGKFSQKWVSRIRAYQLPGPRSLRQCPGRRLHSAPALSIERKVGQYGEYGESSPADGGEHPGKPRILGCGRIDCIPLQSEYFTIRLANSIITVNYKSNTMKTRIKEISERFKAEEKQEVAAKQRELEDASTSNHRRDFLKKSLLGGLGLGGMM